MLRFYSILSIVLLFLSKTLAQVAIPYDGENFIPINSHFSWYEDKSGKLCIDEIIQLHSKSAFQKWDKKGTFNRGVTQSIYWIFFSVENIVNEPKKAIYKIATGVDTTSLYEMDSIKNKKIGKLLYKTSRYTPFLQRPFQYRYTAFPLQLGPCQTKSFFVRLENKMAGTYSPMYIQSVECILKMELERHWIYGIYFGIFIFIILFNIFLYLSMKDTIHLWYAAYVLCAIFFMIQDECFYTELFPDELLYFCENAKQFPFSLLMIATGVKVMQLFVKQERTNSKWYWPVITVIITSFTLSGIILITSTFNPLITRPMLRICYTITDIIFPLSILLLLISLMEKIIQKQYLAVYYLIAVGIMLVGAFNFYFNHLGITNSNHLQPNGVVVGLAFEIVTLSLLLTLRYAKLKKEKELLINQQKQQLAEVMLESQEMERARIAKDLHDGVGGSLTGIRLMLENYFYQYHSMDKAEIIYRQKLLTGLKSSSEEIRTISHNLYPKDIEFFGLFQALHNLIDSLNANQSVVEFSFIDLAEGMVISKKNELDLFRVINELVNNIIKHSRATKALLQCLYFDNKLQLIIEDNGTGFQVLDVKSGIGLKNIKSRIEYMNGALIIDSGKMGTTFLIEILKNNL